MSRASFQPETRLRVAACDHETGTRRKTTVKFKALAALTTLAFAGAAHAVPYTWTDYAGDSGYYLEAGHTYSYAHSISDGDDAYRPGIDSLWGANLAIWLFDDSLLGDLPFDLPFIGDRSETVGFSFDGGAWTSSREVDGNWFLWDEFDFIVTSLLNDGLLSVSIRANNGDFYFGASELTVTGDRGPVAGGPVSVPEPGMLTLLGFGLLGLAFAMRRRRT